MSKQLFSLYSGRPLLDIASYGRGGPKGAIHLSPAQIEQIERTVKRTPEAMVKVLPRNSNSLRSAGKHLDYIGRWGTLELETDDGERVSGKHAGQRLMEDWDLDLESDRRHLALCSADGRNPPKLIHKLMLSMPAGTPAQGVLKAVRDFAREEFALKHRYALVLHTDEPHPHVHLVVKAVSEQGQRLNIRKDTLRKWRAEFAKHLRAQGIAANATERAVRGQVQQAKKDRIYRASLRGESTYVRSLTDRVAAETIGHNLPTELSKSKLLATRRDIKNGFAAIHEYLRERGLIDLASLTRQFLAEMPRPKTNREMIADQLLNENTKSKMENCVRKNVIGISR